MKMWSGRFRKPLDPEFEQWQRSFPYDRRLLVYELEASRAHTRALSKAGALSAEELASILFGLDQIGEKAAHSPSVDDPAPASIPPLHPTRGDKRSRVCGNPPVARHLG